jgi:hypothetical protein
LDESKLLSLNTADFGAETRRLALEAYESRDWYGIYAWTKSWITTGGGAWEVDSWLLYVVSALLHGQPKGAVHSADLALANWIEAPEDRAVLLWVRAYIVHHKLRDPKTALANYDAAAAHAPPWLRERVEGDRSTCIVDAQASRKRKPSVGPAPTFVATDRDFVAGPVSIPEAGSVPSVWDQLVQALEAD